MYKAALSIAFALVSGCAPVSLLPLNEPDPNEAIVYVIRTDAAPTRCRADIRVDGQQAALLSNKSYSAFSITAGPRRLDFRWRQCGDVPVAAIELMLQGGKVYYFAVVGQEYPAGGTILNPKFRHSANFVPLNEKSANELINLLKE